MLGIRKSKKEPVY